MKARIISFVFIYLMIMNMRAQDFHLTQYDAFSLYMNPALTGNYLGEEGDYKISAVYRTQWQGLATKPYSTYGLSYDTHIKRFGVGGYLLDNKSGNQNYNTLNFQVSGSYFITDPKVSPHLISVGVQMGLFYKTYNLNNLLYESQYDYSTGQLNSSIGSGEAIQRNSLVNFDANMGVFYKYKKQDVKYAPYVGFSIFHVNMPTENFASYKTRLPMRFNLQFGCDYAVNEKWKLTPMFLYMNQSKAWEFNMGCLSYYKLTVTKKEDKEVRYDLVLGLNYRVKDAIMVQCGIKKDNVVLRMSYDINTSYLSSYTHGRGGFELTLQIVGIKGKQLFKSMASF